MQSVVMRWMALFIRSTDKINDRQGKVFGFLIYFAMLSLIYEVVARYAFNSPTIWAHETANFCYGAHLIFGGAYALRWGAHVRVEALYRYFPPRTRAIVDLSTWILFYIFCGMLLWQSGVLAWISVERMETVSESIWNPPVWPIKLTVPVAAALILLQGLTKTTKDFYTAITGRELIARS